MRTSYIITAIGIILITIFLSGCVQERTLNKTSTPPFEVDYNIISQISYDRTLCGSTNFRPKSGGFNTGLRVVLKDKNTGTNLEGHATISVEDGGRGLSLDENYACEEQLGSKNATVSVYSEGYIPMAVEIELPKNQLATVEIYMMKNCSGEPTCFDNMTVNVETPQNHTENIDFYTCNEDADCIMVDIPCCSGSLIEEAVNKKYQQEWKEEKSKEYICTGPCPMGSPSFFYDYSVLCTNNKCGLTEQFKCKEGFQYTVKDGQEMCI